MTLVNTLGAFARLLPLLLLAACGSQSPDQAPSIPVAQVVAGTATIRTIEETLTTYGMADFSADIANTVSVSVESQVDALLTRAGSEVKKGQALLRLVPSPTTRLELEKARRDARLAQAEVERLQRLRAEGLATQSELETAINAAGTASSLRDSLAARVGPAAGQTLRAPRDGIVDTLTVQPGEILAAGSVAIRIASKDALQLRLGVEAGDVMRLHAGQAVTLSTLDSRATSFTAQIDHVDRRIDPQTRQAAAVVHLQAGNNVLPGAALKGEIVVASHANAVVVPAESLLIVDDAVHVFVILDGKAHTRNLKTGIRDNGFVEVTEGLKASEQVVVTGSAVLEDGMLVSTATADSTPSMDSTAE